MCLTFAIPSLFRAQPDRTRHQLMHAAHHAHVELVIRQHLAELRLADRAYRRHEIDTVRVDHLLERFHPRQCTLDPQFDQIVCQQTAATTACLLYTSDAAAEW